MHSFNLRTRQPEPLSGSIDEEIVANMHTATLIIRPIPDDVLPEDALPPAASGELLLTPCNERGEITTDARRRDSLDIYTYNLPGGPTHPLVVDDDYSGRKTPYWCIGFIFTSTSNYILVHSPVEGFADLVVAGPAFMPMRHPRLRHE
jgi:hypothetical protein